MYDEGRGAHKDDAKALHWYRKAAKQGLPWSQFNVGEMYAKGLGVQQSDIEAYAWWWAAAERGHLPSAKAKNTLAKYMSERDFAKAKKLAGNTGRNTFSNKD